MEVNNKKKLLLSASMCIILASTPVQKANAITPVVDMANIQAVLAQTAQQLANFGKEMAIYGKQMAQEIQLYSQQMRADLNRSMMEVGQTTQVDTDLFNKELISDLQPVAEEACLVLQINNNMNKATDTANSITNRSMNDYNARNLPRAGNSTAPAINGLPTAREYSLKLYADLERIDEEYSGTAGMNNDTNYGSPYLNPQYLFVDNMSKDEFEIATLQKELLAGPPNNSFNNPYNPDDQSEMSKNRYRMEFVQKARRQILKSSAVHAIQQTISNRYTLDDSGLSKIGSMEKYLDETIRNDEWVKKYTNTDQDVNRLTTSSQVTRALLSIEAKRLELETMNYKQVEQIKTLMALNSLIELDN